VLDSGAMSHMTRSKEMLIDIKPNSSNMCVTYGDGSSSKVLGLGKVVVSPKPFPIIYFPLLNLLAWAFPLSLMLVLWSFFGARL
jgi:hypothetical protein